MKTKSKTRIVEALRFYMEAGHISPVQYKLAIADLPVAEDVPYMEGTMESFNNLMDLGQRIVERGKEIADS